MPSISVRWPLTIVLTCFPGIWTHTLTGQWLSWGFSYFCHAEISRTGWVSWNWLLSAALTNAWWWYNSNSMHACPLSHCSPSISSNILYSPGTKVICRCTMALLTSSHTHMGWVVSSIDPTHELGRSSTYSGCRVCGNGSHTMSVVLVYAAATSFQALMWPSGCSVHFARYSSHTMHDQFQLQHSASTSMWSGLLPIYSQRVIVVSSYVPCCNVPYAKHSSSDL